MILMCLRSTKHSPVRWLIDCLGFPPVFFQYLPVIHNSNFHNIPRLCIVWKNWAFLWRKWILMEEPLLSVIHWAALVLDRSWLCSMSSNADARGEHIIQKGPMKSVTNTEYITTIHYCKPNYTGFKFSNKKVYDPFSSLQCCVFCCRGYGVVSMCIGTGMGAAAVFEYPGQWWNACRKIPRCKCPDDTQRN